MTTIETMLDWAEDFLPPTEPRREAKLIETGPYRWKVEYHFVDLDCPEASFVLPQTIPGPCGKRTAVWMAWGLGFDVKGGGQPD
jgi:hypothetical protein